MHALYPDRIVNKTNGITFRRWLMQANPALVTVLRDVCGDAVLDDPTMHRPARRHAGDVAVCRSASRAAKRAQQGGASRG